MINNNVFAALIILMASLCFCVSNISINEGFMEISGTNAKHAYLPQTYKNEMSIRNFKPHGGSNNEEVRELETFNYNPRSIRNNVNEVEQQFKSIEGFQQRNNINQKTNHNHNTSNNLPKHNLSETYIPKRPDYELSRGVGVSVVTPQGYRNGARPSYGVDLLRGDIFEGYTGSTPQFGSPTHSYGNLRKRGDTQNPDPRGETVQETGQTGTEKKHSDNSMYSWGKSAEESYVPKAIRRGYNNMVPNQQSYQAPLSEGYQNMRKSRRNQLQVNDTQVQQFMKPPLKL
tara:strand:- start:2587 stop:3447 length:861 start_codon:yes stop_codon:yes gene_type:complete